METHWLHREFNLASSRGGRGAQLICEMAIVRLHDAWARFCRELIVTSAFGRTQTLSGLSLGPSNPSIRRKGGVIPLLISTYSGRVQYEPKWGQATASIDAAQRLAVQNLPTVSAALGASNSPAEEIRWVRNYYAHRKRGSAIKATTSVPFTHPLHPNVFELARFTSGGITIIESWVSNLLTVAVSACQ